MERYKPSQKHYRRVKNKAEGVPAKCATRLEFNKPVSAFIIVVDVVVLRVSTKYLSLVMKIQFRITIRLN